MKIRRLEIQGFKSFADRTRFDFGDGISSVVGPNGCGKSNIVDAIKWVLGDMSPRSLRGKRMEDVIFAGSRHRRPVALAEVSLVLENTEGLLRSERSEVEITRRLHRAGESEYLICGKRARLKDVRELFLDTGLGADGNAIMEQGQIDALLNANPQDRRGLFEEAAGVSRYKQRRKEAGQRLVRTEDNLERLLDVLELEEKRLRSLKNQAGRARRYQEIQHELGKKRVLRAVVRYRAIRQERDDLQQALAEALAKERAAAEELGSLERGAREAEAARISARDVVHEQESRIAAAASDMRAAEDRAGFLARSREELGERIGQARAQAAKARERIAELVREKIALEDDARRIDAESGERLSRLEDAEGELRRLDAEVVRLRDQHECEKSAVLSVLGRVSDARNREAGHRAAIDQTEERIRRLTRQRRDLVARRDAVARELDELLLESTRLEAETKSGAEGLASAEARRRDAQQRVSVARARRDAAAEERATKAARLDVLVRLTAAGEGLAEGARAVLEAVETEPLDLYGSRDGVLGVLADLLQPTPQQAGLLDRILGPTAGAIVTKSTADALRWIEWLRTHHESAKARFLCLDMVRNDPQPLPAAVAALGCAPELKALVASVATGTMSVPDLEHGIAHWRETGTNAVTPTGDRVTASGALLGGADGQVLGLVERSAEMRALQVGVARLGSDLEIARADVADGEEALRRTEEEIETLRTDLTQRAAAHSRGREALARVEKEREHIQRDLDVHDAEFRELVEALTFAHEAGAVVGRRVEALEETRFGLEGALEAAARKYADADAMRRTAGEQRMEARLAVAEARARREALRGRFDRVGEEIVALGERAQALEAEAVELTRRVDAAEVEIAEAQALSRRRARDRAASADELVTARERLATLETEAGAQDRHRREVHELHEELRSRLESFRLKDSELRVRVESLVEQVRQDESLELEEVDRESEAIEELDVRAVEEEVENLRRRLGTLGNVNLNAIAELEEVREHVEFLNGQRQDLLDAKRDLENVIGELDEITTSRFVETFEQVRVHFRDTFRLLFGGGRAEIVLEDASNPLESGVDIIARPPGKEQRTISLLSGGERSLTAVALLFAVFKAKPSPFAILDEVDAALDEANVRRLIGLIRQFTDHSQFLIVTHAKTTMEAADVLYGVTMEEPGVSKKVGVRLTDYRTEPVAAAG